MPGSFGHRCGCCQAMVYAPVWDIVQPATGKSVAVCARCSDHIRLLTTGLVWFPEHCPATIPRPKFRLLRADDAALP